MKRRPSRASLEALCAKYREMLRMREADAAGDACDPKPEMRALADRFPGALREIDELPLDEIAGRIRALEAALRGSGEPPRWAVFFADYHGWLRAALRIKRMCVAAASREDALAKVRATYRPAADEPSLEALGDHGIADILSPPGGRLNPWVFARIAELHETSPDDVAAALFPPKQ